jgi:hypothetical protein
MDSTSLAAPQFSDEPGTARQTDTVQVYFRKKVNLNGTGVTGMIYLTADNDLRLFINEQYILDDVSDNFTVLDSVDFSVMQPYLKSGENVFVLHVIDTDGTAGGVKLYGHLGLYRWISWPLSKKRPDETTEYRSADSQES